MNYPQIRIIHPGTPAEEYYLALAPPEDFKGLIGRINDDFKDAFEKRAKRVLKDFGVQSIIDTQFNWDQRGLSLIAPRSQYGVYLLDHKRGFEFKNVNNPKDAIAFLNIVSLYYHSLKQI